LEAIAISGLIIVRSGSPLNRVGFLRPDHAFLSAALKHPSTSFLLFNKLEPLVKSGTELAYANLKDVQPIIGIDPFEKSEEDVIKDYNSATYVPQLIFLGLDESKEGFVYKEWYKGQPYFAVDVTPKESVSKAAEELIKDVEGRGLSFSKGRMHMSLPAQEGTILTFILNAFKAIMC
jgi:NAD+ diphosphatase